MLGKLSGNEDQTLKTLILHYNSAKISVCDFIKELQDKNSQDQDDISNYNKQATWYGRRRKSCLTDRRVAQRLIQNFLISMYFIESAGTMAVLATLYLCHFLIIPQKMFTP